MADWCDDHGEPEYATFIRVQCELAGLRGCDPVCSPDGGHRDGCVNGNRGDELRRRERELFAGLPQVDPFPSARGGTGLRLPGEDVPPYLMCCGIVRRGFVDEIRVPTLAVIFGGECEECEGQGYRTVVQLTFAFEPEGRVASMDDVPCEECGGSIAKDEIGTGRTPGIAAAIFAAHPVTAVVVSGLEPMDREAPAEWAWCTNGTDAIPGPAFLPPRLWAELAGGYKWAGSFRVYNSRDAALAALSDAICTRGRQLAGLTTPVVPAAPTPPAPAIP